MGSMNNYSSPAQGSRPDRPLIVRCGFNRKAMKVTFRSARNCTIPGLRAKIQEGFSLSAQQFVIKWKDDDGEYAFIEADEDLDDAIKFHQGGEEESTSSGASALSYRSSRSNKITLPIEIQVDYDGPSLSDSSSLSSREEFEERNDNHYAISLSGVSSPQEGDARTVSSRDTGHSSLLRKIFNPSSRSLGSSSQNRTQRQLKKSRSRLLFGLAPRTADPLADQDEDDASTTLGTDPVASESARSYPTNGQAVFAQLRLQQRQEGPSIEPWLREQSSQTRIIATMQAATGLVSYDSDSFSLNTDTPFSDGDGPFADHISLEINHRGEKYYTYRSSSSEASRDVGDFETQIQQARLFRGPRPFSIGTFSSESGNNPSSGYPMSSNQSSRHFSLQHSDPGPYLPPVPPSESDNFSIPPELLVPDEVTSCSECGLILESVRYICTTCGEKPSLPRHELEMMIKNKDFEPSYAFGAMHEYPPTRPGPSSSSSSDTLRTLAVSPLLRATRDPIHNSYRSPRSEASTMSRTSTLAPRSGYELCSNCVQIKGMKHALLGGEQDYPSKFGTLDTQAELSAALRSAPHHRGYLRHAFAEKLWGSDGWQDLEQGDTAHHHRCSGCATQIHKDGYSCATCSDFTLCRGCYSDVHNVHPIHAFLVLPEHPSYPKSESDLANCTGADSADEPSMKHPDVLCHHCGQDIVGARFKCAICTTVNICSNCETIGLPGNLDDDNVGHSSSHILIKFPVPLGNAEEQSVTRNVRALASRDSNGQPRSRPSSISSLMGKTVMRESPEDHFVLCNGCDASIVGTRYQCLSCPSKYSSYNLCEKCEVRSYQLHNPRHIFIMLTRPVDNPQPLESDVPLIPFDLYETPAGPMHGTSADPEEYLQSLTHRFALCDRHVDYIKGRWYRCVYCEVARDLCTECQSNDSHDPTHAFIVFKAPVDINQFRVFANLNSSDNRSPPVLNDPIYDS